MGPDLHLVLCDTARADAFFPWNRNRRTPTMQRLAREGTVYARATSQAPWTLPSTASILSGRLPSEHGITADVFRWVDGRPTSPAAAVRAYEGSWLPESLRDRGYRTWAASCNTWISEWGGFSRGFDEFENYHDRSRLPQGAVGTAMRRLQRLAGSVDRGGREAVRACERRLARRDDGPLFVLVNLMECHGPYDPPRPYYPFAFWRRRATRRLSGGRNMMRRYLSFNTGIATPPPTYVETVRELYYEAARYEDALLSRVIAAVERRDRPAVVAVVADHGENLGDHGLFNHNSSLHQSLLHVPFVLWGHRVDVAAGSVDDAVSLLGLADRLRAVADGDDRPVAPAGPVVSEYESTLLHTGLPADIRERAERADGRVPPLVFHAGMAAVDGRLKYVATADGRESLHDLDADPGEHRDVLGSRPADAERFRALRGAWTDRRAASPTYDAGALAGAEIEDHLRSLGYIE